MSTGLFFLWGFGALLGRSWGCPGGSRASLGASWASLGGSWGARQTSKNTSRSLFGRSSLSDRLFSALEALICGSQGQTQRGNSFEKNLAIVEREARETRERGALQATQEQREQGKQGKRSKSARIAANIEVADGEEAPRRTRTTTSGTARASRQRAWTVD